MDQYVKACVDTRRDSLEQYFLIPDDRREEIDGIFAEMEALAETCKDTAEFEQKLAASPINQKYMDLFATLKPDPKAVAGATKDSLKERYSDKKNIAKDVGGAVATEFKQRVIMPMRHEAYEERKEFLRDNVPGYMETRQAIDIGRSVKGLFGMGKDADPGIEPDGPGGVPGDQADVPGDQTAVSGDPGDGTENDPKD